MCSTVLKGLVNGILTVTFTCTSDKMNYQKRVVTRRTATKNSSTVITIESNYNKFLTCMDGDVKIMKLNVTKCFNMVFHRKPTFRTSTIHTDNTVSTKLYCSL